MALLKIENLSEEQREIAELVGMEGYMRLSKVYGGTTVYIAKTDELERRNERDERIREEFDGTNYSKLAIKYRLSEMWIRNIVSEKAKEIKNAPFQGQMSFDFFEKYN